MKKGEIMRKAILFVLALCVFGQGAQTISVIGSGAAETEADYATFTFTVREGASAAGEEFQSAEKRVKEIKGILKDAEVLDSDVQVKSLAEFETNAGVPFIAATAAAVEKKRVTVTIRSFNRIEDIMQGLVLHPVDLMSRIYFHINPDNSARQESEKLALADAKAKATRLATELGVTVGQIVSVEEISQNLKEGYPEFLETTYFAGAATKAEKSKNGPANYDVDEDFGSFTKQIKVITKYRVTYSVGQ